MTDTTSTLVARAHVVTLPDVQVEPVRWLWPGRIPYGKLTVLDGDPGLGKSQLTLKLAADVTTGRALLDVEAEMQRPVNPAAFCFSLARTVSVTPYGLDSRLPAAIRHGSMQ